MTSQIFTAVGTTTRTEPSADEEFLADVIEALSEPEKRLPCKYFYDRRGSQLFDRICELDEYYLTRAELEIMQTASSKIARTLGKEIMLVEYGSGSSLKTRLLLDQLDKPVAYVPVDISRDHLRDVARRLAKSYPHIEIIPVSTDFLRPFRLPLSIEPPSRVVVYFPGSTIGNLTPEQARALLRQIRHQCGTRGGLLIGIDLQKDISTLEAAYNDRAGVTAEFNRNLLVRINRELGGNFDLRQFRHEARYDQQECRIEMRLVSQKAQIVSIDGHYFEFAKSEAICTEFSHKYTIEGFSHMATEAGFRTLNAWTDRKDRFAVLYLKVRP